MDDEKNDFNVRLKNYDKFVAESTESLLSIVKSSAADEFARIKAAEAGAALLRDAMLIKPSVYFGTMGTAEQAAQHVPAQAAQGVIARRAGRPRKAEPAAQNESTESATGPETGETGEEEGETKDEGETKSEAPKTYSKEEVIALLNRYATVHPDKVKGAKAVMAKFGEDSISKFPPDKYYDLAKELIRFLDKK